MMNKFSRTLFTYIIILVFTDNRGYPQEGSSGKGFPIFNGKDLEGWIIHGTEKWYVEGKELICESGPDKGYGYLATINTYKDFDLSLEFLQEANGNSGIFFRSSIEGTRITGWQAEVAPPGHDTGGIYESYGRGWLIKPEKELDQTLKMNQWNSMRVLVNGDKVTTWLNGVKMIELTDDKIGQASGKIALQIHDGGGIKIRWRNIVVNEFGTEILPRNKNQMTNQSNISTDFPFESKYLEVKGSRMHYIDEGGGTPFLFLHGNPTSSYLWRNIIPHLKPHGRVIAVDLIGMGKSDKPDIDYRFLTHAAYIDEFIEKLELENIVLVIHDWGSALGFHYAFRHQANVKGLAFMEAILRPMKWKEFPFLMKIVFKRFRNEKKGKKMIMEKNFFVEKLMKMAINRKLSQEEMDNYRTPYPDYNSRFPLYVWPNEIPIDGFPEDNHQAISDYSSWLKESEIPKLFLWVKPGAIIPHKQVPKIEGSMKNLTTVFVGSGKHYLQEDQPDAIGQAIANWFKGI